MSGRRLREAMKARLVEEGIVDEDAYVVASGPANTYSHVSRISSHCLGVLLSSI